MPSVSQFDYPFDPTGNAASNKINNEIQPLVPVNFRDFNLIVPRFAPFFADSVTLSYTDIGGVIHPLVEGVDYYFGYWYIGASRACAKDVYGSIQFLNTKLAGTLKYSYQTIGGQWTLNQAAIATILSDRLENPRITTWEQVTGVPTVFPIINHEWDLVDQIGLKDVTAQLTAIATNLRQQGTGGLGDHIADYNNPHHTDATHVGLGNVKNFGLATQAQAKTGTSNSVYMTPLSTMWAMTQNIITPFQTHTSAVNPHGTGAHDVGAYTQAETIALLDDKLDVNAAAYDSQRLGGLLIGDLTDQILSGTAANSLKFNGYTYTSFMSLLDTRYVTSSSGNGGSVKQYLLAADAISASPISTPVWVNIGSVPFPGRDLQWLIDGVLTDGSGIYNTSVLFKLNVDTTNAGTKTVSGYALAMDGVLPADTFGYVVDTANFTIKIWLKTINYDSSVVITNLDAGISTVKNDGAYQTAQPAGIKYITSDAYATQSQLSNVVQTMTSLFNTLATAP